MKDKLKNLRSVTVSQNYFGTNDVHIIELVQNSLNMLASLTLNQSQFYFEFCKAYFQRNMVDIGKIWNVNCVLFCFFKVIYHSDLLKFCSFYNPNNIDSTYFESNMQLQNVINLNKGYFFMYRVHNITLKYLFRS